MTKTKKVDLEALRKAKQGKPQSPVKIKEPSVESNNTIKLFDKARHNKTHLLRRSHVSMTFDTIKDKNGKEIRQLIFDNSKIHMKTEMPATEDAKSDELECYKGMCIHALSAIDEIE